MAERRVLTDDPRMVWMAELSDHARHSEMVSERREFVGVEQTVVCGLDAESRTEPIGFAACLARRLGWRLSLVPLPDAATEDERLGPPARRVYARSSRILRTRRVPPRVRPRVSRTPSAPACGWCTWCRTPSHRSPGQMAATVLRDSQVPVMVVPRGPDVPRTSEAP
jgi:hypothetical protein